MAIALDSRNTGATSTSASTLSWSHTVGSGLSNSILVVGSGEGNGSNNNVSSVVWDSGGANTALSNTINGTAARKNDTASQCWAELWYLLSPAAGTKTIKVTYGGTIGGGTGSESWSGVDQTTPFNAASPQVANGNSPTQPSITVTSAAGEQVIDAVVDNENTVDTLAVGGGHTTYAVHNPGSANVAMGGADAAGAATVTMSWSGVTLSAPWAQVAVSMKPDAGGGGAGPTPVQAPIVLLM